MNDRGQRFCGIYIHCSVIVEISNCHKRGNIAQIPIGIVEIGFVIVILEKIKVVFREHIVQHIGKHDLIGLYPSRIDTEELSCIVKLISV